MVKFKITLVLILSYLISGSLNAAEAFDLNSLIQGKETLAPELSLFVFMTALSFIPVIVISLTAFTRIIIVLSMLRFAFGMQSTPPNVVLIVLSLFFTLFVMQPTINDIEEHAYKPYVNKELNMQAAVERAGQSFKQFMIKQTREKDLGLMFELSKMAIPKTSADINMTQLIPAFMLSELRTAFQIGFILFLPFLMIDLIVAGTLMSLGMIMVPPMTIAMPLKILVFVLVDGWALVTQSLLSSFHVF